MRVRSARNNSTAAELAAFSEYLLQVGEGRHEVNRSTGGDFVKIPQDMLIDNNDDDREESEDDEIRPGAVPRGLKKIIDVIDGDTREFPFRLRRKQFPVVPAFAMTINKAQGQTIQNLGLYLATPCFSHGQLYVALLRITSRSKFKALIEYPELDEDDGVYTDNIVYRQIFDTN
ncbi:unnamed protein product [Phytophthora fragariaefolia]|uniref:Unnamed protein product n=1 Tax=Phytophthora fragariaefolia TaxID=1490495 RepID=A0A9W6XSR2_9STRA|nr:unnamed protein product [Phytophthora fragariaefolia]